MKVHVTGATGFIGKPLLAALAAARHEVVMRLEQAGAVVHLAGIAHRRATKQEYHEVNVTLAERVGRLAAAHGARFLFISSVKVHGDQSSEPLRESSPLFPLDDYARSKARAEEMLGAIAGLSLTILRPPLVYGPGVKANLLALMRAVARGWPLPLASIDNRRSLIYVGNLVDAIVRCLSESGTFLVSDGPAISTPQLCCEMGDALGRPARLFPFPPALLPTKLAGSLEVDDSAIRQALGWQPPFSRKAGLQATAGWYREREPGASAASR